MHELKTTTVELGKESNSSVMQRNGSACGYLRIRRRRVMNAEQDREEEPRLKLLHLDAEYVNGLGKTARQQRSSTAAATSSACQRDPNGTARGKARAKMAAYKGTGARTTGCFYRGKGVARTPQSAEDTSVAVDPEQVPLGFGWMWETTPTRGTSSSSIDGTGP